MPDFALNHVTLARTSFVQLLEAAAALGCVGVELRNDLPQPLFDGMAPERAGAMARDRGLRLLALAEVKRFDDWTPDRAEEALALIRTARACGAEAVSLIPRNDGAAMEEGERQAALRRALRGLAPMLADHGLVGLIEPLGFATCALRQKAEVVAALRDLPTGGVFRLVHDSFHHHLAGGGPVFAAQTGMVHVSGVTDPDVAVGAMEDRHRGLVDGNDRLGSVAQVAALISAGYAGPVSFECFAPAVHDLAEPVGALGRSMEYMRERLVAFAGRTGEP